MNIKDEVKKLTPVFLLERKQWLHLKHESLYQLNVSIMPLRMVAIIM